MIKESEIKRRKGWKLFFLIMVFLCNIYGSSCTGFSASDKWSGVDEAVVEKYAREHSREASKPFINTDQGDLLLFVFLLAGTVGGFIAGYCWRELMERETGDKE